MLHGIDVSNNQGVVNWGNYRTLDFAFAKATEGIGFQDGDFPQNWRGIKANGLVRGAYDFAHPGNDPVAEADYFLSYVRAQGLGPGDLLALDLEVTDGVSPAGVASFAQRWCAHVAGVAHVQPVVYTFLSFAQQGNCAGLGGYPLWIADPSSPEGRPTVPGPWRTWAFHQYANSPIDQDVFNGTASQLAALGVGGGSKEETVQRLCVLGMSAATNEAIPANSDQAIKYEVVYLDPNGLRSSDGYSIVPKVSRDYHIWARCAIAGLKAGNRVSLQFGRYAASNGAFVNEIHHEDRVGDGNPVMVGLYCFDTLDTTHRVRFSVVNHNGYPVTVSAAQFRLAI